SGFVTTTFTGPAACAAVVAVIFVALTTTTLVGARPPTVNVTGLVKPEPKTAMGVPPAVGPLAGATDVITGGGVTTTVDVRTNVFAPPPLSVTVTVITAVPLRLATGV